MHIAIAGNIGAGKTTLTDILAAHYGWKPSYEGAEDNPYLNDFYNDMPRWAFNLQIHFLHSRLQKILEIKKSGENIIQDRSFYEVSYIFARNLYEMGLMPERDYKSFIGLFELTCSLVQPPDLIIYLRAKVPTLLNQIRNRGRAYEQGISADYLSKLNQKYEAWASEYSGRLMTIDIDNLDFPNKKEDREKVILMIDKHIKTIN
ncbi:MAG: deoxynucleoside kinase [Bacteroidales bacterium]|nr:deoxynucleoside kinase [Bacteroidales bacterium]